MPTNRVRRLSPLRSNYSTASDRVVEVLLSGHDFEFLDPTLGEKLDEGMLREAWRTHREALLRCWVFGDWREVVCPWGEPADCGSQTGPHPGTRPDGWWKYEATEDARPHETEREYLRRHELLLGGEAELLQRQEK
jgi:hypothetical protein